MKFHLIRILAWQLFGPSTFMADKRGGWQNKSLRQYKLIFDYSGPCYCCVNGISRCIRVSYHRMLGTMEFVYDWMDVDALAIKTSFKVFSELLPMSWVAEFPARRSEANFELEICIESNNVITTIPFKCRVFIDLTQQWAIQYIQRKPIPLNSGPPLLSFPHRCPPLPNNTPHVPAHTVTARQPSQCQRRKRWREPASARNVLNDPKMSSLMLD